MTGSTKRLGRRIGGAVVALVLLPSFAPDLVQLACPHHGDHAPAEAVADGGASKGHATHAGNGAAPGHEPPPPCTCAGQCPIVDQQTRPVVTARVVEAAVDTREPALQRLLLEPPYVRVRYLLPPANAPPLT